MDSFNDSQETEPEAKTAAPQGLQFLRGGSMLLTGLVQECADVYLLYSLPNRPDGSSDLSVVQATPRKRKLSDCTQRRIFALRDRHVNFTATVVHLKLLLKNWESVVTKALEKNDYLFRVKALLRSLQLLKFVAITKREFISAIKKALDVHELQNSSTCDINASFVKGTQLKLITRLFCTVVNQAKIKDIFGDVTVLLNTCLDSLNLILEILTPAVEVEMDLVTDWLFLIAFPWLPKLHSIIPGCQSESRLNSLHLHDSIIFDDETKQKCLSFLRFEIFYPLREVVNVVLREVILNDQPLGVLKCISGMWWPAQLLSWDQILKYCCYIVSQKVWLRDERIPVALAEVVARLPCIYARIRADVKPYSLISKGCRICGTSKYNETSVENPDSVMLRIKSKKYKLKFEDEKNFLLIMRKLLQRKSLQVHLQVIDILYSLRKHTKMTLLTYTSIFWKIFCSTNFTVQLKVVDVFGRCTRPTKCVKFGTTFSRVGTNPGTGLSFKDRKLVNRSDADIRRVSTKVKNLVVRNGMDSENTSECRKNSSGKRKSKIRDHGSHGTKTKTPSKIYQNPNLETSLNASMETHETFRHPSLDLDPVCTLVSRRDILTNSKSAFPSCPPAGRFDTASFLYNQLLYQFYMASGNSHELDWAALVDFQTLFVTFSRHADADVWAMEILRLCLHMLAKLDMVNVIILCQRVIEHLAGRANCRPWELCAKYRETFADEIRKICLDRFFHGNSATSLKDQAVIQSCLNFFLKIRTALDLHPKLMVKTFLRLVVKRCVLEMFDDNRQHTLVAAISQFDNSPLDQFLTVEFAYYYPHVLLNSNNLDLIRLKKNLGATYGINPIEIMKYNPQHLHIEMVSNIFEYRDNVLHSYVRLMGWNEDIRNNASRLRRAIGDELEKLYMGIFLHFESKFRSKAESVISKRRYLGCFAMLIGLLGKKRITNSKLKLYSTLNSLRALGPDYNDLLYQAWRKFANNLDDSSLRSMATQICAGLTYLRKSKAADVDTLVRHIFSSQDPSPNGKIRRLYFLQNTCNDSGVRTRLKAVVDNMSTQEFFYQLVDEIGDENSHVRFRAVQRIATVLEAQFTNLSDLQFDNYIFTSNTTKLLQNLLQASREANTSKMKLLCARCIGMIGALDPRRFDSKAQLSANAKFGLTIFTVGEPDFLVYFIEELTRDIRGAVDTRDFDSCALCIQEIIKLYSIEQVKANPIWPRLSSKAQDLLKPLFFSKYTNSKSSPQVQIRPIFMTSHGNSLREWMYNWVRQLSSVVTTESTRRLFAIVTHVVHKSDRMGLVLLPYVASYSLLEGSTNGADIFLCEVCAVLSYWVQGQRVCKDLPISDIGSTLQSLPTEMDVTVPTQQTQLASSKSDDKGKPMENNFPYSAAQVVFKVFDHLTRLVRNPRIQSKRREPDNGTEVTLTQMQERSAGSRNHTLEAASPIKETLRRLRYDILSSASFACRNFARALMYMEQHLNDNEEDFDRCFTDLQRIYVALFDEDSVKGLENKRKKEATVMEEALNKLSQGKLEPCMPLFETIVGQDPSELLNHQQLVYAYMSLNQFDIGEALINGCCSKKVAWSRSFDEASLEISLVQGKREDLAAKIRELSCNELKTWGLTVSKASYFYNHNKIDACLNGVKESRLSVLAEMNNGAAWLDMGFYFRHYQDFIRLQLLTELEEMSLLVSSISKCSSSMLKKNFEVIRDNWGRRIKCAYKSTEILRPIISFRKMLLEMTKPYFSQDKELMDSINFGVRDCYVQLAKLESGLGNYLRAQQLFLESKLHSPCSVFYEEAKMLFEAAKYDQSLKVLEIGMNQFDKSLVTKFKQVPPSGVVSLEQIRYAKSALLFAKLMDDQKKVDFQQNINHYKFATDLNKTSEKNYFYLACYYDRLWSQSEQRDRLGDIQVFMVQNYGASLACGCNYLYQSLSRMLTIWFDYSSYNNKSIPPNPEMVYQLTKSIDELLRIAPTYIFITAFSQLVSRLAHINTVVYAQLKKILAHMVTVHPEQVLWMIISVLKSGLNALLELWYLGTLSLTIHGKIRHLQTRCLYENIPCEVVVKAVFWKLFRSDELFTHCVLHVQNFVSLRDEKSTYPKRVERCNEVLSLAEEKEPMLKPVIRNYRTLADKLIQFTMKKSENSRFIKVSEVLPALSKLIKSKEFSGVLLPFQAFMSPVLPRGGKYIQSHKPFPTNLVYIADIQDPACVMTSLQRPKRVTFVGTDGRYYHMMCKPSDDLRKDLKVMEINSMVHWYMSRDKDTRKRNLIIRTYNVTPLSDTCGILEWIPNLHGYRPMITSFYKEVLGHRPFRGQYCERKDSVEKKRKLYLDVFVAQHPIVMSHWFLKSFQDPQSWYMARTSYVKTAAVMSIIGFLMGLGDRHGENILLDSSNGDVVHVDFNCLFNKGEAFDWPERVPFRLTRNMLNGMGPLGHEGLFRCCCELVMKLVRNHSSVFLSIIRPFVFDPLLEWEGHVSAQTKHQQIGECNNAKAVEHLNNIRDRLLGKARNMTKKRDVALSVEAHVNYLIKESTKLDNLCQMYIGWAAYL